MSFQNVNRHLVGPCHGSGQVCPVQVHKEIPSPDLTWVSCFGAARYSLLQKGFSGKKTLQHMLGVAQSIIPALVFSKLCYLDPFRQATSDAVCVADQLQCSNDQGCMKLCAVRSMTRSECCSIPASHARLHMLQSATRAGNFASAMQAVHTLVPVAAHCRGREAEPEGNLRHMESSKH